MEWFLTLLTIASAEFYRDTYLKDHVRLFTSNIKMGWRSLGRRFGPSNKIAPAEGAEGIEADNDEDPKEIVSDIEFVYWLLNLQNVFTEILGACLAICIVLVELGRVSSPKSWWSSVFPPRVFSHRNPGDFSGQICIVLVPMFGRMSSPKSWGLCWLSA